MKEYLYSLSVTSQYYFCGIPFRLDTTPKCSINCLYCFAMARGGRRTSAALIVNPNAIARKLQRAISKPYSVLDVNGQMLKRKVPIHFGGMSDPFSNPITSSTSKRLLQILSDFDYPTVLSTKNTTILTESEVLEKLSHMKYLAIQISLCTVDNELAAIIEPNAPSPNARLKAIRLLSDLGFHLIVRLQPLIPALIDEAIDELIPAVSEAGAKHVIVEFIKLPVERKQSQFDEFLAKTEWNLYQDYKQRGAKLIGREWLLPSEIRWNYLQPVISSINEYGMTYGAGDYGLNHLSDTDCCCGISHINGFGSWFNGNLANVLRQAPNGYITTNELKKYWYPKKSIRRYMNSNSRLPNSQNMLKYLRHKWNSPGTPNAPDQYLGIYWTNEFDCDGNCIYLKDYSNFAS